MGTLIIIIIKVNMNECEIMFDWYVRILNFFYHKIGKGEIVKLVYLYFYGTFDKMQHKRIEDCVTDRKLRVGVNVAFCG